MILLRHGQTVFNLHFSKTRVDPGVADPPLTPLGETQARDAAKRLSGTPISRIVASPYQRAIQTALIVAEPFGVPVEIEPDIRERAGYSCDIGSEPQALADRWPELDFSALEDRWWAHPRDPKSDGLDEPEAVLDARVHGFRARVAARDDWAETLVVCHWGPIRSLVGYRVENGMFVQHDPHAPIAEVKAARPR
jgi:broad specificity phosphatase PhoE